MKKANKYYELVDRLTMIHYENLNINYLECLLLAAVSIIHEEYDRRLSEDGIKESEDIIQELYSVSFTNEEVRLASQLLIVKAFKHTGLPLDLMTPDTINYLIADIVERKYRRKHISILDTALGTGNLLLAVSNYQTVQPELFGIEHDCRLVRLAKAMANLQGSAIIIYCQDALKNLMERVDVVIGDLDAVTVDGNAPGDSPLYEAGVRYFPYLLINIRLRNLKHDGFFIYVIDNDFFSQPGFNAFRDEIKNKASLMGLIVLPEGMFQNSHCGKSILIGKKIIIPDHQLMILTINDTAPATLRKARENIHRMIDNF